MFFSANPKWESVDPLTIIQIAPLMENVDPDAVVFSNGKFTPKPNWLPPVDQNTLDRIYEHFIKLTDFLNINRMDCIRLSRGWGREAWGGRDFPKVQRAYVVSILKKNNYNDKRFNPARPPKENESATLPIPSLPVTRFISVGKTISFFDDMMEALETHTPKPAAISATKPKGESKKQRGIVPPRAWEGLNFFKEDVLYKADENEYLDYYKDNLEKIGISKTQGRVYFMKEECEFEDRKLTNKEISERLNCGIDNIAKHYKNASGKIEIQNTRTDIQRQRGMKP